MRDRLRGVGAIKPVKQSIGANVRTVGTSLLGCCAIGFAIALSAGNPALAVDSSALTVTSNVTHNNKASIGQVLTPGAASFTVVVPTDPTTGERQALFNAVAALTSRFPAPTKIVPLVSDSIPRATSTIRVVTIRETTIIPGNTVATQSPYQLAVTGSSSSLTNAAIALSSPSAAMSRSTTISDVSGKAGFKVHEGPVPLAFVTNGNLQLAGTGSHRGTISINQPAFGQPVQAINLYLRGTAPLVAEAPNGVSPGSEANGTPGVGAGGATGSIVLRWNGTEVGQIPLTAKSTFDIPVKIGADQLRRNNTLEVELNYHPANNLPVTLKQPKLVVDLTSSSIEGVAGNSVKPGFELLPQGLGGYVAVAEGQLGSRNELAIQAATLIASLQSATPQQLAFGLWEKPSDLVNSDENGIVVGADAQVFGQFDAPTNLAADQGGANEEELARLIAFNQNGRNLLLLGSPDISIATNDAGDPIEQTGRDQLQQTAAIAGSDHLATATYAGAGRWEALTGQGLAISASGATTTLLGELPVTSSKWHTTKIVVSAAVIVVAAGGFGFWWIRRRGQATRQ